MNLTGLDFTDKLNLKNNKTIALANLSIYHTHDKMLNLSIKTISSSNLPDGSYSIADIQNYFEFIIKKHETFADNNAPSTNLS